MNVDKETRYLGSKVVVHIQGVNIRVDHSSVGGKIDNFKQITILTTG